MQCIIIGETFKLTHYGETKKRAHDSQVVRALNNLNLSHGGPSRRQAPDTYNPMQVLG